MTPPPRPWLLAYRLLGLRLPEEHRAWVAEDVKTRSFLTWRIVRTFLTLLMFVGLYAVGQHALYRWPSQKVMRALLLLAVAWALLGSRESLVRKTLVWQRIDKKGAAARPRRIGLLDNREAVVGSVAALVLFTNAAVVFGYSLRPSVPVCEDVDVDTAARIRDSITFPGAEYVVAKSVTLSDRQIVAVLFRDTKAERNAPDASKVELLVVTGEEVELFPLADAKGKPLASWTSLPRAERAPRPSIEALRAVVNCTGDAAAR